VYIDYNEQYAQIEYLKSEKNSQKRGYKFEQIIREILPWSYRPPVTVAGTSEQLDAFFSWDGRDFLVESKAKVGTIKRGSHDWEDFELKIRKRFGQVVGIFCSLYGVSGDLYKAADEMSRQGLFVVIIDENISSGLRENQISLDKYILYVIFSLKSKQKFDPEKTISINAFFQDKQEAKNILLSKLSPISALFLRRHKLDLHEKTYVARGTDELVRQRCAIFRPSNLNATKKKKKQDGTEFTQHRSFENQIILVRDVSGAGKTTLAVELALNRSENAIAVCRTASDPALDGLLDELRVLGSDFGLEHLRVLDTTLLYVIDSLDEAEHLPGTRKAVISLNRSLDTLNSYATQNNLARFPIFFVYTLREEHWRAWDGVFEGLDVYHHRNRFSFFDNTEIQEAIRNYSNTYGYRFSRMLEKAELESIRSPFDLFIFSETFAHEGEIDPETIFSQSVLSNYFQRKSESIAVRPLSGISSERVIGLLALLATKLTSTGQFSFEREDAYRVLFEEKDISVENYDRILNVYLSENILVRSSDGASSLRFRHNRFIEYLVSLNFANQVLTREVSNVIGDMISASENSAILSVVSVCDTFRKICRDRYKNHFDEISAYFAKSVPLLKKIAEKGRLSNAHGKLLDRGDIEILEKGIRTGDADLAWDVYFVLLAKVNRPSNEKILELFGDCWALNATRRDAWKMISRISSSDVLSNEKVVRSIISSRSSAVWLTYFDQVARLDVLDDFSQICKTVDFVATAAKLCREEPSGDWSRVVWVLSYLSLGRAYPIGVGEAEAL
jgi:hypothetical protein